MQSAPPPLPQTEASVSYMPLTDKDTIVVADFDNKTGDVEPVSVPECALRPESNGDPKTDDTSFRHKADARCGEGALHAGRQQSLHWRIHREPRQRVRPWAENGELPERRNAGARASNRQWQGKGTECVGRRCREAAC